MGLFMTLIYIFMRTLPMITIHELRLLVPPTASVAPSVAIKEGSITNEPL